MFWEMEVDKIEILRPFFKDLKGNLVLSAILEQNSPAQIWVDDNFIPKSVFLWDKANNVFYLSGDGENITFNNKIEKLLECWIIPELLTYDRPYLRIRVSNDVWTNQFSLFFKKINLEKTVYGLYSLNEYTELNWEKSIPPGFQIVKIGDYFLRSFKSNIGLVTQEIQKMWTSIERFIEYGFGFSLVAKNKIVCWCTAEYLSEGKCGIGIETIPQYRNRGLATLTASVFIEYCRINGINPFWECNLDNKASRRVAEKIGFSKEDEFIAYSGMLSQLFCQ
jgi:RimJ/RimL family protein N-acetyltransferase